jgi:hypothetical protein
LAWRKSTRPTSALDGPSPGTASSAAPNARRASSHWRARYAARPSEYLVRNNSCFGASSPCRPKISKTAVDWVCPATTNRSISRTSISAPAAATVLSDIKVRLPYSRFTPFQARCQIHRVAHYGVAHPCATSQRVRSCRARRDMRGEPRLPRRQRVAPNRPLLRHQYKSSMIFGSRYRPKVSRIYSNLKRGTI